MLDDMPTFQIRLRHRQRRRLKVSSTIHNTADMTRPLQHNKTGRKPLLSMELTIPLLTSSTFDHLPTCPWQSHYKILSWRVL